MEFESQDEPVLSEENKVYLMNMIKALQVLIENSKEPLDSKVLGLLEIAYDLTDEQIKMDKYYHWDGELDFIEQESDDNDIPSVDDLKKWFK